MAAAILTAPPIRQIKQIAYISPSDIDKHLSVEQTPGGYQLPFATIFNLFGIYGHMKARGCGPTICMQARDFLEAAP